MKVQTWFRSSGVGPELLCISHKLPVGADATGADAAGAWTT